MQPASTARLLIRSKPPYLARPVMQTEYIVICQSAWCNANGFGIDYTWDGERFSTRKQAIRHGFKLRESDDFNIGVVTGKRLVSFDWMERPVGEDDLTIATIAQAIDLTSEAGHGG